jgi:DNA-binding PadR family transcriptional regulator
MGLAHPAVCRPPLTRPARHPPSPSPARATMSTLDASMSDARDYLPLSPQQFQILLALSDADRHGYGIILEVAERTGGATRLGTGTLYTALAGLEDGGLVVEPKKRPSGADDPRRRYYRLTPFGRAVLEAETSRLDALVKQARRKGVTPIGRPALEAPAPRNK